MSLKTWQRAGTHRCPAHVFEHSSRRGPHLEWLSSRRRIGIGAPPGIGARCRFPAPWPTKVWLVKVHLRDRQLLDADQPALTGPCGPEPW